MSAVTRYVIDPVTAVRLVREGLEVPQQHRLVAPALLRSQVLSALYRDVRAGATSEQEARRVLDGLATLKVRLLNDRVSRATAWKVAVELGWDDTTDAEYVAVTRLQADALVAGDPDLARRVAGGVPTAGFEELVGR